jgi:hypothetical protein
VDFKDVAVGGVKYGEIKAGAATDYQVWRRAYRYASVSLLADAGQMTMTPIDYVGERKLGEGHFTYVLTIQEGRLNISVEKEKE